MSRWVEIVVRVIKFERTVAISNDVGCCMLGIPNTSTLLNSLRMVCMIWGLVRIPVVIILLSSGYGVVILSVMQPSVCYCEECKCTREDKFPHNSDNMSFRSGPTF